MTRRLRIAHLVVQPVLVWDDGEELLPGPGLDPAVMPLSHLAGFMESLPRKVAELAEQLNAEADTSPREKL